MKYKPFAVTAVLIAVFVLHGCTSPAIKIDATQELRIDSPLAGMRPLTFVVNEFSDARLNRRLVGVLNTGEELVLKDQKVPEIIALAVSNELKQNGHRILSSGDAGSADVIIDGNVGTYWIQSDARTMRVSITGRVEAEIKISVRWNRKETLSKTYRGEYNYKSGEALSPGTWEYVINQAMISMIREFMNDEKLIQLLKQAGGTGHENK